MSVEMVLLSQRPTLTQWPCVCTTSAGTFYIWKQPFNLHKITRNAGSLQHYHQITHCVFLLSVNLCQSSPPGQIMQARGVIMPDTGLADRGWNFSFFFFYRQRAGTTPLLTS